MLVAATPEIPRAALRKLEFLIGEGAGIQTLYPPEGAPIRYPAAYTGSCEACERFLQLAFFAELPDGSVESGTTLITFHSKNRQYEMWVFTSLAEEPLHLHGNFQSGSLVLLAERPWEMPWGLQRIRYTLTPHPDGSFETLIELWEPDGYTPFRSAVYCRKPLRAEKL